jgi:hypothetical protein
MRRSTIVASASATAVLLLATACGSSTSKGAAADNPTANKAKYCKVAKQVAKGDGMPTTAQLRQFVKYAPDAIGSEAKIVGPALLHAGKSPVAQMNAYGRDDVESAVTRIDAWETKACGIKHEDGPQPGSSYTIDPKAQRVDVSLEDFSFALDGPIAAGRTSFVATNKGEQAHFLGVVKLKDGVTLEQAIQSEDESGIDGFWESKIAAAGGDEEVLTVDLQPGNYGLVCFLPDVDGTPHAMKGMTYPFTVA